MSTFIFQNCTGCIPGPSLTVGSPGNHISNNFPLSRVASFGPSPASESPGDLPEFPYRIIPSSVNLSFRPELRKTWFSWDRRYVGSPETGLGPNHHFVHIFMFSALYAFFICIVKCLSSIKYHLHYRQTLFSYACMFIHNSPSTHVRKDCSECRKGGVGCSGFPTRNSELPNPFFSDFRKPVRNRVTYI